jgi:hypothetical protein
MNKVKFQEAIYQGIPLSPDDSILIEAIAGINNCLLNIQGTAVNFQGDIVNFNDVLNVTPVGTLLQKTISLGYKFLLSVTVSTFTLLIPDGDIYVRMSLINPSAIQPYFRRKVLDQGYVSTYTSLSYGSGSVNHINSDHFSNIVINPSNPAAGAEIRYDVPAFVEMILYQVSYLFAPSAAVATRFSRLQIQDVSGNTFNAPQGVSCPASTTRRHTWGMSPSTGTFVTSDCGMFLSPIPLRSGCSIRTFTEAIQAADQYSAISLLVRSKTVPFA